MTTTAAAATATRRSTKTTPPTETAETSSTKKNADPPPLVTTSTTPSPAQQQHRLRLRLRLLPSDVWALVLLHCDSDTALSVLREEEEEEAERQGDGLAVVNDDINDNDAGPWKYVIKSLLHRQHFAGASRASVAAAAALSTTASTLEQQQPTLPLPTKCWRTWSNVLRYRRQLLSNLMGCDSPNKSRTIQNPATTNRRRRRGNAGRNGESSSSSSPFAFVPIGPERVIPGADDGGPPAAATATRLDGTRVRHNPRHVVDVDDNDDDPPMVPFECDTFLLLRPDTDEFLFLHPVKGTVVHANNLVQRRRRTTTDNEPAGGGNGGGSHVVPQQVLLTGDEPPLMGIATDHGARDGHDHEHPPPELSYLGIECKHVVIDDGGNPNGGFPTLMSTVIAVGRQWVFEDPNQPGVDRSVLTEIKSWERSCYGGANYNDDDYVSSSTTINSLHCFGTPRLCRFHHHFFTLDLDATNRQLLLVPMNRDRDHHESGGAENGGDPNAAAERDDDDEMNRNEPGEAGGAAAVAPADAAGHRRPDRMPRARGPPAVENDDEPMHACGSRFLHVLPLVPAPSEGSEMDGYDPRGDMQDSSSSRSSNSSNYDDYLPRPLAVIDCGAGITSVSSSGDAWAVSTGSNELLWYEGGQLVHRHRIIDCVRDALRRPSQSTTTEAAASRSSSPERELLLLRSVTHHAAVEAIRFAPFAGPDRAGFVTLSHGESSGSTVLLWKKKKSSRGVDDPSYHVDAVVRLPLKASRIPKVHFDGRRLIVSGEDHLGHILLIYVVQSPDDPDGGAALDYSAQGCGGGSGGVIASETLRFARRIRHPAMGGLEEHDTLQLSANERFIVVNTRRGHEMMPTTTLAASRRMTSPADGLFVVDAETTV